MTPVTIGSCHCQPIRSNTRDSGWTRDTGALTFGGGARGPAVHPLLGSRLNTALKSRIYEGRFSLDSPKYLKDHQVQGSAVVPAAAYIEQGFASARECFGEGHHAVENIAIQQGMFLPAEGVTDCPGHGGGRGGRASGLRNAKCRRRGRSSQLDLASDRFAGPPRTDCLRVRLKLRLIAPLSTPA